MALPKTDSFTAADQDLDAYDFNWAAMTPINGATNKLRIVSNAVEAGSGFSDGMSRWVGAIFTSDQSAQIVIGTSNNYPGPAVRCGDSVPSLYGYFWLPGLGLAFRVEASGTTTQIASGWTSGSAGDTIYLEMVGTTLTGKINGSTAGTVTDGTYVGGVPGLFNSGANHAAIDDFIGDNVPPTGAVTGYLLVAN